MGKEKWLQRIAYSSSRPPSSRFVFFFGFVDKVVSIISSKVKRESESGLHRSMFLRECLFSPGSKLLLWDDYFVPSFNQEFLPFFSVDVLAIH